MSLKRSLALALVLTAAGYAAGTAFAHEGHEQGATAVAYTGKGTLVPVNETTDAAWLAQARADYAMTTCAVSGDKFDGGDMGKPQDYVYKQEGKSDRLVRFCCKDCVRDFKKDPAKYLKMIDDAAAAKVSGAKK